MGKQYLAPTYLEQDIEYIIASHKSQAMEHCTAALTQSFPTSVISDCKIINQLLSKKMQKRHPMVVRYSAMVKWKEHLSAAYKRRVKSILYM